MALALLAGAGCAAIFAELAREVASGRARAYDSSIRQWLRSRHVPVADLAAPALTAATSPAALIGTTLAVAVAVRHRGPGVWVPLAVAPLLAMTAGQFFTEVLPQQFPPDGKREPCFPSGHTTGATAEILTIACVLDGEGIISRPVASLLGAIVVLAGVNRVYRDRHWASDVVAGWTAGGAVASICAAIYELRPRRA